MKPSIPTASGVGAVPASYSVRLAAHEEDVRAAQRLRFAVFNLELNEGLAASFALGRDEDPFDAVCDHLIVTCEKTGEVVGTYRLQTGPVAARRLGYYSAREFDLASFESVRGEVIELGRACVHKDHRSMCVLMLLWRGIGWYATRHHARYFIGCSSVTSQEASVGAALYERLAKEYAAPEPWRVRPLPAYELPLDAPAAECPPLPKLLRAYLGLGARICGPPAIDREFSTIDFLTFLDLQALPASVRDHFLR